MSVASGFVSHDELVEALLGVARDRIRFALEERAGGEHRERLGIAGVEHTIRENTRRSLAAGVDLPLAWLETRLGLDEQALRIVWVLLAHEMCEESREMLRRLNTEACADPTTDAIRRAAFGSARTPAAVRLLAADGPLVRAGLIQHTDDDPVAADHRKTWKIARRVLALAYGDVSLDPDIAAVATLPTAVEPIGIGGELEHDPACLGELTEAIAGDHARTVIVQGPRGTGRRSMLRLAAATCGVGVLEVDTGALAAAPPELRAQVVAIARDYRLFEVVPLLRDVDTLLAPDASSGESRLDAVLRGLDGLLVLATTSRALPGERLRARIVEPASITGEQRARLWRRALPSLRAQDANHLATLYPVSPAMIAAAAAVVGDVSPDRVASRVRVGLRGALGGRLNGMAKRIDTGDQGHSLVLPGEQCDAIIELIARVRRRRQVYETWGLGTCAGRGLGVSALFSGPPGTGKTMAAGMIAEELGTDLYQVDTSRITSKWIGETEKNLAAVFDAAEAGHAILLFDEADALFGKRTEVRTSNDRHANQETNYLLQRLESFRGVCILTTNHDTAIDAAFRRRISLHVQFPMPDVAERALLWKSMIRDTVPVEGVLDFEGLAARYELSGGHVRNAVLRAAFFAADAGTPLTNRVLNHAAHLEYQAMGRIVRSSL